MATLPQRTWVEINTAYARHNLAQIRRAAGKRSIMAILKANAYGHGAVEMARVFSREGIDAFGVGDSGEALELREAGIKGPILIVGAVIEGEMPAVVERDIEVNLHTVEMAEALQKEAARQGKQVRVHLKIDTGMGRLGMQPFQAVPFLHRMHNLKNLELVGLCTHFSYPYEENPNFTLRQLERFNVAVDVARRLGYDNLTLHAASSLALFRRKESLFNMVRPGVALWGLLPGDEKGLAKKLKPVLAWKTRIVFLKDVPEGQPIGYNRTYYTPNPTRIATLPVGYNDGYRRALSNKSDVLINGKRCPVVGLISMDYTTVDVSAVPNAKVGDVVTLIGKDGNQEIGAEDLAAQAGVSVYELMCGLGRRVVRVYS